MISHLIKAKGSLCKTFALFLFLLLLLPTLMVRAQDIPSRPVPPRLVNDLAGVLSDSEVQQLESKLVAFNDSTSTQLVVVTVKSLNGYDKNEFAYRIGQSWGVGQKGKNNGAVILVKPKYQGEGGQVAIQTGYGVEGAIPDALAKRIVENEMIPRFGEGNYYQGINAATSTMISLLKGEFTAEQYKQRAKKNSGPAGIFIAMVILVIVFVLIRGSRSGPHSVGRSIPFWTALWMLGSMGGGSRGSWNNFSSGSGGFGGGGGGFGGGGGGFGGFGGGSFGGGGAGGSW